VRRVIVVHPNSFTDPGFRFTQPLDDGFQDVPTTVTPRQTLAELGAEYTRTWGQPVALVCRFDVTLTTDDAGLLWDERIACEAEVCADCDGVRSVAWHFARGDARERIGEYTESERDALEQAARTNFFEVVEQMNR
jgi:uncharacterized protein YbjT (DUF2867 family)